MLSSVSWIVNVPIAIEILNKNELKMKVNEERMDRESGWVQSRGREISIKEKNRER